ncbi:MAG: hypothetical protein Q9169_000175 [Polycauliona sp. 2 TL-2023]
MRWKSVVVGAGFLDGDGIAAFAWQTAEGVQAGAEAVSRTSLLRNVDGSLLPDTSDIVGDAAVRFMTDEMSDKTLPRKRFLHAVSKQVWRTKRMPQYEDAESRGWIRHEYIENQGFRRLKLRSTSLEDAKKENKDSELQSLSIRYVSGRLGTEISKCSR